MNALTVSAVATVPSRADAPAAIVMAILFLSFGVFAMFRPQTVRAAMDAFAASWGKSGWHPYRMPLPVLRFVVGSVGIAGAALFFYIAYIGVTR